MDGVTTAQPVIEARVRYTPHESQRRVDSSRTRFNVLAMGRRWGKTMRETAHIVRAALKDQKRSDYYWVAPTSDLTEIAWTLFERMVDRRLYTESKSHRYRQLINGATIYYRSADDPRSLIGRGLAGLVMDECGDIQREAWEVSLRPALSEHRGWADFIGTPRGRNWFYELWMRGRDEAEPDWASFQCPTAENPYIPADEIEAARRSLPEVIFRQEYLAEFLEDGAGAFRGVDACIEPENMAPPITGEFAIGADLAKHTDWTVLIAMHCASKRCVAMERFNQIDWPLQKERIREFAQRWKHATVILDATGVGDPIYDDLARTGMAIKPFKFTNASKIHVVQQLIVALEQRKIRYPAWRVLLDELKAYGYKYSPSGVLTYSAPEGYHDDCVMALALALEGSTFAADLMYLL